MSLPKIQLPLFDAEIPSTGKKVKFRPFTVKEEKILLIAKESKDISQVITSIKQIINNCFDDVDPDKLATFDLEYLLIQARAKSISDIVTFNVKDIETDEDVEIEMDLNDVVIKRTDDHTTNITLDETTMLVMRYPSLNEIRTLFTAGANAESLFKTMIDCIETVVQGDSVYKMSDFSEAEVVDFANSLTAKHVGQIKKFFEGMPVVRYEAKYINKNGNQKTYVIEGLESFFI